MKINKETLLATANKPTVICWSDLLQELNLIPVFRKYQEKYNKQYDIKYIFLGQTLIDELDKILLNNCLSNKKDKRVKYYTKHYRRTLYGMDYLNSCPTTAKEDIDYLELINVD